MRVVRPERRRRRLREEWPARFERLTTPEPNSGCLLWIGTVEAHGYGVTSIHCRRILAHRAAWETAHGPIPYGLYVLHSCDTPACCNVAHLRLGTQRDNIRDAVERRRIATGTKTTGGRKDRCLRGHDFDVENTYRINGRRHCRACRKWHKANIRRRQAERLPNEVRS